jgi:uncharacterized protein (TIGR03435 family)
MKRLTPWIFALAALSGSAQAQNITGSWQGSLQGPQGPPLRIVIKITLDNDKLKAVAYSIDQNPTPIPVSAITKDGSTIKMTVAAINGSYEGKLTADGNSINGTWTQGAPAPLNLARATPETAWTIPEPPPPPVRMAANANPAFEVATIKPSDPSRPGKLFTVRGKDVVTINTTLSDLVTMSYNLHAKQIVGAPAWFDSEKYDLTGRPDVEGQPSTAQLKVMIQKLLADRFQLKFHREKKELAVYTITVTKTGSKITKSEADPAGLPTLLFGRAPQGANFNVRNATLADVAGVLQGAVLDKPVVDQTGLTEKYDFLLKFTPDSSQMTGFGPPQPAPAGAAAVDPGDAFPDLFTAFQQQLGLKLESTKAPADVIVIDKVEKPSAN